jgi:hypothetical protein
MSFFRLTKAIGIHKIHKKTLMFLKIVQTYVLAPSINMGIEQKVNFLIKKSFKLPNLPKKLIGT